MPLSDAESAGVSGRWGGADDGPQFNIELAEGPEVETSGRPGQVRGGSIHSRRSDMVDEGKFRRLHPDCGWPHDGGREPEVS